MKLISRILIFVLMLASQKRVLAQLPFVVKDTVVAAATEYSRPSFFKWMWGQNRRQEWRTPVKVPIFMLDGFPGGLNIYKSSSGGNETQSLRLRTDDKREYVLRSINKSRKEVIPKGFEETFVENVIQDGVSMSHPFGAFALAGMQQAAGILHTSPKLVYLPQQNALDSFNDAYANKLYLFEERPDEDWSTASHMGGYDNYSGTDKVIENVLEDSRIGTNQFAFAKVRLFDMLIGDWDRHADNFRWGKNEQNDNVIYEPVPRDRDQVFYTHNGWLLNTLIKLGGLGFMTHFDEEIKGVTNVPAQQKDVDMFFTNSLTKSDWIRAATELQVALTDSVIRASLKGMPAEIYDVSGEDLLEKLVMRKEQLKTVAEKYYQFLAREVIITGSELPETFLISSGSNSQLTVSIFPLQTDNIEENKLVYSRSFNAAETKSIIIYGIAGADKFQVDNNITPIKIKIIAGPGNDTVMANNAGKLVVVDSGTNIALLKQTKLRLQAPGDSEGFNYRRQQHKPVSFNAEPHLYYSADNFFKRAFGIALHGEKRFSNKVWRATAGAWIAPVKWINYFGIGNETLDTAANCIYNRFKATEWGGSLGLRAVWKNAELRLEGLYFRSTYRQDDEGILYKNFIPDTVFSTYQYAGPRLSFTTGKQNDAVIPTSGWLLKAEGGLYRNIKMQSNFSSFNLNIQSYIPLGEKLSLALKAGSAIVNGADAGSSNAQWFQHAIIGGPGTLRGYRWNRFWGNTAFYNQNELRFITDFRSYLLNAKVGAFVFTDNGRVWQKGQDSDKWHGSYGAGLLLVPFYKMHCSLTWAVDAESNPLQFAIHTKL